MASTGGLQHISDKMAFSSCRRAEVTTELCDGRFTCLGWFPAAPGPSEPRLDGKRCRVEVFDVRREVVSCVLRFQ